MGDSRNRSYSLLLRLIVILILIVTVIRSRNAPTVQVLSTRGEYNYGYDQETTQQ
jgi:hypothetical protein